MKKQALGQPGDRVALVAGVRTPFAKQGTSFRAMTALDLGREAVLRLIERTELQVDKVDQLVFGQVLPSLAAPNVAREIILSAGLPAGIEAFSVSRACATSYQSIVSVAEAICAGTIDCGIAGGTDSASDIPMTLSAPLSLALQRLSKAKTWSDRAGALRGLSGRDWKPIPPALTERSTGLSMGQSAEKMAQENGITREEQDAFAHQSHARASAAWSKGHFDEQVAPVFSAPDFAEAVERDSTVRDDSSPEGYAGLRPVFDRTYGTITAGNSSPLTDGASALLLMRESLAKAEGYTPLGYLKSYAFAALDPAGQMLMGPAYATPLALERAGVKLADLAIVDMHEAFSAQVLSNLQAFESADFAKNKLGRSQAIGNIDMERFNVDGGSIALGHPFAATGARQATQALHALKRAGGGLALCTACAAGGIGAAVVWEAA